MNRNLSTASQHLLYFSAAALAAQANVGRTDKGGFRQKDFKFLIDLFSNWMEAFHPAKRLRIHNTQVSRYLDQLIDLAFVRRTNQSDPPRYHLTRAGILGLLGEMVNRSQSLPIEEFLFLHYFVNNYAKTIRELIEKEGAQFPRALRIELEALLDAKHLLDSQLRFLEKEISKMSIRVEEAIAAAELARKLFDRGAKIGEVVLEIQKKYPYELNNQKTLQELFTEIPDSMRRWELEQGTLQRALQLWQPQHEILLSFRETVKRLQSQVVPRD